MLMCFKTKKNILTAVLSVTFAFGAAQAGGNTGRASIELAKENAIETVKAGDDAKRENAAYERLLAYKYRPSVAEFLNEFGGRMPSPSMFKDERREMIASSGPGVIAALEYVYPQGIYAALGRDSFLLADIIEAFYLRYGMPGRAAYLHASTSTVTSLAGRNSLVEFLKSNGFGQAERPFVIMDRTSMGLRSQSTQLYDAAFKYLESQTSPSMSIDKIVHLLGVASTAKGFHPGDAYKLTADQKIYLPLNLAYINGAANLTDFGYWTNTYGDVTTVTSGQPMRGEISSDLSRADKIQVLNLIYDCLVVTSNPEFMARVSELAGNYGYDFLTRIDPKRSEEARLELERYKKEQEARALATDNLNYLKNRVQAVLVSKFLLPTWSNIDVQIEPDSHSIVAEYILAQQSQLIDNFVGPAAKSFDHKITADEGKKIEQEFISQLDHAFVERIQTASSGQDFKSSPSGLPYFISLLPEVGEHNGYLSANGKLVMSYLEEIYVGKIAKIMGAHAVLTDIVINSLFIAKESKKIDSKDLRRIVLMLVAKLSDGPEFMSALVDLVNRNTTLRDFMIRKNEVFLTSERFQGQAAKAYAHLVGLGVLPESTLKVECKKLLEPESNEPTTAPVQMAAAPNTPASPLAHRRFNGLKSENSKGAKPKSLSGFFKNRLFKD